MNKDTLIQLQEYKDIVDNANDLIQSVNHDGSFRYINKAWKKTLGYSKNELSGMTVFDIIHPEEIEHCQEVFGRVMQGENVGFITTRFISKNGDTIAVEGNVNCELHEGVPVYTRAIFRDITKIMETERVVRRLYERERTLRESLEEEINRRTEFSRILVHELKTPLTSIMGLIELLSLSEQKPPYDRAISSLNRSAVELNERIGELLELTRAEVGTLYIKPRRINPCKLISDVIRDIQLVATAKSQNLTAEVPPDLEYIRADRKRLRQVIQNVVDNAIKATPEGGDITVKAIETMNDLTVKVTDTGRGINGKDLSNIFEPYYRVSGVAEGYGGLGLGLTLSKRIIELHGGQIWADSEDGQGSTFSFCIPKKRS